MTTHAPEAPTEGPEFLIDDEAYQLAKIKLRLQYDKDVAARLGVAESTWVNVRRGKHALTEQMRRRIRQLFGADHYSRIVLRQW